jgi:SAM-dependent methyltransferase
MFTQLRSSRLQIDQDVRQASERQYLSPAFYGQYAAVGQAFRSLGGRVIDLGCGIMPYAELLPPAVTLYHGLDITVRNSRPTLIGNVQSLGMLRDRSYDSVICLEVLEHVPDPARALSEIARILTDDGIVVLSVPHLSRLHEIPHDYYRYTEYGLRYLLQSNELEPVSIQVRGGLFSFLGHQADTVLLGMAWGSQGAAALVRWLNRYLVTWSWRGGRHGSRSRFRPLELATHHERGTTG